MGLPLTGCSVGQVLSLWTHVLSLNGEGRHQLKLTFLELPTNPSRAESEESLPEHPAASHLPSSPSCCRSPAPGRPPPAAAPSDAMPPALPSRVVPIPPLPSPHHSLGQISTQQFEEMKPNNIARPSSRCLFPPNL